MFTSTGQRALTDDEMTALRAVIKITPAFIKMDTDRLLDALNGKAVTYVTNPEPAPMVPIDLGADTRAFINGLVANGVLSESAVEAAGKKPDPSWPQTVPVSGIAVTLLGGHLEVSDVAKLL